MKKCVLVIMLLIFCCSSSEKDFSCIKLSDKININSFVRLSDYNDKIFFNDESNMEMPNLEFNNYSLHFNFIDNDTFYVNRVKSNYEHCILKIKKDSIFNVIDSICFTTNEYVRCNYLSNNRKKLAVIYDDGNISEKKSSLLEIQDLENRKVIFKKKFSDRFFLEQNPWATDDEHIVLYNSLRNVYTLNIKTGEFKKVPSSGSKAMWLQSLNKIAYLKERNVLAVYDLKTSLEETYEIKDKIFYKSFIGDYYWFAKQKKFYVKTRFSNLFGDKLVPWKNKNYILEYESSAI